MFYKVSCYDENDNPVVVKFSTDVDGVIEYMAKAIYDKRISYIVVKVSTGVDIILARWTTERLKDDYYNTGLDGTRSRLEVMGF